MARLARLPPGLEMIAAADTVEAGLLSLHRLAQQLLGWELLVCADVEVPGGPAHPTGATPPGHRQTLRLDALGDQPVAYGRGRPAGELRPDGEAEDLLARVVDLVSAVSEVRGDRHRRQLRWLRQVLVQRRRLGELALRVLQRRDRLVAVLEAHQQLRDPRMVVAGVAHLGGAPHDLEHGGNRRLGRHAAPVTHTLHPKTPSMR